jgi:hypothetical protein
MTSAEALGMMSFGEHAAPIPKFLTEARGVAAIILDLAFD